MLPAALSVLLALQEAPVDFVRDVLPVLSKRCHECHGSAKQKSGLRLDVRADAFRGGDSGPAVVPRDPAKSLLLSRVTNRDPEERMPPKNPLPEAEIALLRRWIESGAPWPDAAAGGAARVVSDHWAFRPVRRPEPPRVKDAARVINPIDAFVLARLEEKGMGFSPPADRRTLARRLSLDLVGLPPTPEEVDAFEADGAVDAVERYVDRLLASPHYGERWARRWLDLARYADTNGYEKDRDRSIWPWRDWVIRALNEDLPFDRFTVEQIAGDFLGVEIATGFHRNTMTNEEGGIDVEEFRFESTVDRVGTTGTVWLGLTLACAQCHTHKFDPITQRGYYGVFAFLNNADEPEVPVPDADVERRREEIARRIAELEAAMDARFDEDAFRAWKAEQRAVRWAVARPAELRARIPVTFDVLPDASVLVSGDNPNNNTYTVVLKDLPGPVRAIRLEVLPHPSLPEGGPGRAPLFSPGDFHLGEFSAVGATIGAALHSYAQDKRSAAHAIDGKPDTGWSVKGRVGEAHHAVFVPEKPLEGAVELTLAQEYIHQMTVGRFRLSVTADEPPGVLSLPAEVEDALASGDEPVLGRHWTRSVMPGEERKRVAELRKTMPRLPTTLVMRERRADQARTTRLHHRGQFLTPKEGVEPAVPAVLPPLAPAQPRNRLGFARWLVDPVNPLTPRVIMNRHWQAFFGRGIVSTLENFGVQGAKPSHPELLDWLASEFVVRGWSQKAMHRLIATSAAYGQSSRSTPELLARDPENLLLGRAPRFRLEAELVRDGALAAAGLLDRRIGGRSVYPPQPEGVTEVAYGQPKWPASRGPDRYRRGLYTFMKRTAPYAAFAAFDAPSGEVCAARRDRSNTPLQALNLLNDPVYQEAARAIAKSAAREADPSGWLFRRVLLRPPTAREREALLEFRERQRARLASGELDAAKLGGDPETASWTLAARVVLNLDEAITRE